MLGHAIPAYPSVTTVAGADVLRFAAPAINAARNAPRAAFLLVGGRAHTITCRLNVASPRSIAVSPAAIVVNAGTADPGLAGAASAVVEVAPKRPGTPVAREAASTPLIATFADVLIALNTAATLAAAIEWLATNTDIAALLFDERAAASHFPAPVRPARGGGWKTYSFRREGAAVTCNGAPVADGDVRNGRLVLSTDHGAVVTGGSADRRGPIYVAKDGWVRAKAVPVDDPVTVLAKERGDASKGVVAALAVAAAERALPTHAIQPTWAANFRLYSAGQLAGHRAGQETVPALLHAAMTQSDALFPPQVGHRTARSRLLQRLAGRTEAAIYNMRIGHGLIAAAANARLPIAVGRPFVPIVLNKASTSAGRAAAIKRLLPEDRPTALYVTTKEDGWRVVVHSTEDGLAMFTKTKAKLTGPGWDAFAAAAMPALVALNPCVLDTVLVARRPGRTRADAVSPTTAQLRVLDCYVARGVDVTARPYYDRRNLLLEIGLGTAVSVPPAEIHIVASAREARVALGQEVATCRERCLEGIVVRAGRSTVRFVSDGAASDVVCIKPAWDAVRWPLRAVVRFLGWGVDNALAIFGVRGANYGAGHHWHGWVPVIATQRENIEDGTRDAMLDVPEVPGLVDPTHRCYVTAAERFYLVTCERLVPYRDAAAVARWAPSTMYMQGVQVASTASRRPTTLPEFLTLAAMACNPE